MSSQVFRKVPCASLTTKGNPCSAFTVPNSPYCQAHTLRGPIVPPEKLETLKKTNPGRRGHSADKWEAIVENLREGMEKVEACKAAGVSFSAFKNKVRDDSAYRDIVETAFREEGILPLVTTLKQAAMSGHVPAIMKMLAVRSPEWKDNPTVTIQDDRPFDRDALIGNIIKLALEVAKRKGEPMAIDVEAIEPLALPAAESK